MNEKKAHWEEVYATKSAEKQSWTQERPSPSLEWIMESLPNRSAGIIDVGGGTSHLVDFLLEAGYAWPAVLDISAEALSQARSRLGPRAAKAEWIEADITSFRPNRTYALWHDRAVFHFLTKSEDRRRYLATLNESLDEGGKVILATFSPTGPKQCSGLDVMRFDAHALANELGNGFQLVRDKRVEHQTPWGAFQSFQYCEFRRA